MVTAPAKSVATATDAVLSCTVTDITETVTVTWKNGNDDDLSGTSFAEYTVDPGSYKVADGNQLSTLTITPAGMTDLADVTTGFTCVVKSKKYATHSPDVFAYTPELTKLTYGRPNLKLSNRNSLPERRRSWTL